MFPQMMKMSMIVVEGGGGGEGSSLVIRASFAHARCVYQSWWDRTGSMDRVGVWFEQ